MSRNNNLSESRYGQIKLKCPRGHKVGVLLFFHRDEPTGDRNTVYLLKDVLKAPEIEEQPDGKLESVENFEGRRMEWGKTVGVDCEICGRPYWTFWETVEPEIAKLADTPVGKLTLDDDPLC